MGVPSSGVALLIPLLRERQLSAYLVPSSDAHQSEYVAEADMRRAFISGFDGSAGLAVIVAEPHESHKHALFTDGRYFAQAARQLGAEWELVKQGVPSAPKLEEWLLQRLPVGSRVGLDARTMSVSAFRGLETALAPDVELVAVDTNLVDAVWPARPPYPRRPVFVHGEKFAGESHASKIERVRVKMREAKCGVLIVSALDEIAWLLNLRGSDVDYNPVFISYVLLTLERATLFVDASQIGDEVRAHLDAAAIELAPYDAFFPALDALASTSPSVLSSSSRLWLDLSRCNSAIARPFHAQSKSHVHEADSPIALMKAVKNEVELAGIRQAHRHDGAAMVRFWSWLEAELKAGVEHNECSIADRLEEFRREQPDFMGLSFATIAGSGDNGAVIHYHAQPDTCARIDPTRVLLLDSGAQYRTATTDCTRTHHFGAPTAFEKQAYTRVLQGHIALASVVFPTGVAGPLLDVLARRPLWDAGLDFLHGTGHGVGAFLNVHEGPHGISASVRSPTLLSTPLQAGFLVTNEPGFYHEAGSSMIVSHESGGEGATHRGFGIRIENLCIIVPRSPPQRFADKQFLGFDTVSLTPISRALIDRRLMSAQEIQWLDEYHAKVRREVGPLVDGAALEWLHRETEPL